VEMNPKKKFRQVMSLIDNDFPIRIYGFNSHPSFIGAKELTMMTVQLLNFEKNNFRF
jgi:hypothetical protein